MATWGTNHFLAAHTVTEGTLFRVTGANVICRVFTEDGSYFLEGSEMKLIIFHRGMGGASGSTWEYFIME